MKKQIPLTLLYKQLRRNAFRVVVSFKTDWKVDRAWLRLALKEDTLRFVHMSTPTSTHLFPIHQEDLDTVIPYLFASATRREIMLQYADILATPTTLQNTKVVQYFDGHRLTVITREEGKAIFQQAAARKSYVAA